MTAIPKEFTDPPSDEITIPERLRIALAKLNPDERLLLSVSLCDTPWAEIQACPPSAVPHTTSGQKNEVVVLPSSVSSSSSQCPLNHHEALWQQQLKKQTSQGIGYVPPAESSSSTKLTTPTSSEALGQQQSSQQREQGENFVLQQESATPQNHKRQSKHARRRRNIATYKNQVM
jgi:hypothetical protein